jgi:hypothetical protein
LLRGCRVSLTAFGLCLVVYEVPLVN